VFVIFHFSQMISLSNFSIINYIESDGSLTLLRVVFGSVNVFLYY